MVSDSRTIRASIGPKVLDRAKELFDQSPTTIFSELLQNARRASAWNAKITITELGAVGDQARCQVVMTDDGHGIADPAALVRFGGSDWSAELDRSENAAGMGFYSLAAVGAKVRSQEWEAEFRPDGFAGREDILVLTRPFIEGARVDFVIGVPKARLVEALQQQSRFCPIRVLLDGEPIEQRPFLEDAVTVTEILGVRIGVFRGTALEATGHYRHSRSNPGPKPQDLNFYGRVVDAPHNARLITVAETTDGPRPGDQRLPLDGKMWWTQIDVVDAPDLRLVLPARTAIIDNEAWKIIRAAAERAIYETIAGRATHYLAHKEFARGREIGIALPFPAPLPLMSWRIQAPDENTDWGGYEIGAFIDPQDAKPTEPIAFLPVEIPSFGAAALGEALSDEYEKAGNDLPNLVEPNDDYAGYPGYDAIPAGAVEFEASRNGKTVKVEAEDMNLRAFGAVRDEHAMLTVVDDLTGTLRACGRTVRMPIAALALTEERGANVTGLIVAGTTPKEACRLLMEQSFYYGDDDDSDERESHFDSLLGYLRKILESSTAARAANLADAMKDKLDTLLHDGTEGETKIAKVEMTPKDKWGMTVVVTFEDGTVHTI